MNTILSFMDKLYSDGKTLSIVYVVGAVLLFIFIILLIVSLRKNDTKETTKIIEEPKIDEEPKEIAKEEDIVNLDSTVKEAKEEQTLEQSIFEKTTIIPLAEMESNISREENIAQALENVENVEPKLEEEREIVVESVQELSKDIPDVDEFVDNVVKKTYEKNEQFSSVFVGNNTSTIKLDKVMENLNVDEEVKESIVPEVEKTIEEPKEPLVEDDKEEIVEMPNINKNIEKEEIETPKTIEKSLDSTVSLDGLKKALEEKQKEVSLKQEDLKTKLEGLKREQPKSNETMNAEDLLNKLNSIKEK